MSDENKAMFWVQFASAAIASGTVNHIQAAVVADAMLIEWDKRFGDAAYLLQGQSECATCHRPLTGDEFTASADAVKFCNMDCLKASGREE